MADIEDAKADSRANMRHLGVLLLLAGSTGAAIAWNPDKGAAGQYSRISTGRIIENQVVRRELDYYLAKRRADNALDLARQLREGQITLAQWEIAMRQHIKRVHLNAIALERGGWSHMTQVDYGRAGQIIRGEYGALRRFAEQIASGEQRLDGRLAQRAQLYTYSGRTSWYDSKHANLDRQITHVRSIRHARDSCIECVHFDGVWYRLKDPAYKMPGRRICNRNCLCSEELGAIGEAGETIGVEVA
jgi:hypothetical protein